VIKERGTTESSAAPAKEKTESKTKSDAKSDTKKK